MISCIMFLFGTFLETGFLIMGVKFAMGPFSTQAKKEDIETVQAFATPGAEHTNGVNEERLKKVTERVEKKLKKLAADEQSVEEVKVKMMEKEGKAHDAESIRKKIDFVSLLFFVSAFIIFNFFFWSLVFTK